MSLAGIVSGLIGGGQKLPTLNLAELYQTIKNAGAEQQSLINALPPEIQKNLQDYAASMGTAGSAYESNILGQGQNYLAQMKGLYGPGSDAATAENLANKTQIYSTLPGTQNAIRQALAASGGLARGNAGAALAAPVINAATQYGQAAENVNARQTQQQQQATQEALTTVNSMNDAMFQNLFGMSKEQARTILTTGNQALQNQLSQLITESVNRENATLGIQGAAAQNAYQNAITRNQQQAAVWNGLAQMGIQGIQGALNPAAIEAGATADPGYGLSDYFGALNNPISNAYSAWANAGG